MKNKEIIRDIPVIYIGPTIKKYGLNSGNIFIGSLSINIQETLKKFPILKELFVPTVSYTHLTLPTKLEV